MKSTREVVLQTLLQKNRCTISDLAEEVGINPISVRHHIAKLEADGMVSSEEEHHGVGRPRRVYFLTEKGFESFPSRYVQLSNRLIEQLKLTMPKPMVETFFSDLARRVLSEYADPAQFDKMSLEDRLNLIKNVFSREGINVEWKRDGDSYHLKSNNCPFYQVGQCHPEVCLLDRTMISTALKVPIESVTSILEGDDACEYVVSEHPDGRKGNG
jgi:DeoR family transcriptional regulator, suf operon transcriptional repressor